MKVKRKKIPPKYKKELLSRVFHSQPGVSHGNDDAMIIVGIQGQDGSSEVTQQQNPPSLESRRLCLDLFCYNYLCVLQQVA